MDGIANVAKQQVQANSISTQGSGASEIQNREIEAAQNQPKVPEQSKINSKEDMEALVTKLNKALDPLNTSLKFGVDKDDIFYVSVIEQKTNEIIRRFPAEKAADFLPKMQEVTGMLFDLKG